jgi:DNA modification methylase
MTALNVNDAHEDDFDVDAATEAIEEPTAKLGQIYKLGKHRLMCGDACDPDAVAKLMDGKKATMIFTDPPYNVDYGANKNHPSHKIRSIMNDKMPTSEWETFCKKLYINFKEYCDGDIYMWGACGPEGMRMRLWLVDFGCHWSATIVWKKQQFVLSTAKYQRMYEPSFYGWFGKSSFVADRKQVEVWEFDRPRDSKLHPTMKPIELCVNGVKNSSNAGDIVLDLFGGSGSTLIACEQAGRVCFMSELDPKYCDVIIQRWETFTGKKAELIEGEIDGRSAD